MEERTVLVTGATDGLGRRVARDLAYGGATVLIHGRSAERLRAAAREISEGTGNNRVRYYLADLSSLGEVRRMAEEVRYEHDQLDVLVNNAGVILTEREETEDGVELTFAVNYLSHFLLARLVLPLLARTPASAPAARIVNVASAAQNSIDFADPMLKKGYDAMRAYAQSKLAMVMHAFDLAGQLKDSGVAANALHPASLMDTKMVRGTFGYARSTVEEGAKATERLAASPKLEGVSGRYFDGKREARANRQAYDEEAREKLRVLSERLAGLRQAPGAPFLRPLVRPARRAGGEIFVVSARPAPFGFARTPGAKRGDAHDRRLHRRLLRGVDPRVGGFPVRHHFEVGLPRHRER